MAQKIYKYMIKDKTFKEYVDIMVDTYASIDIRDPEAIETLYKTKEVLLNEYEVDMMTLPFKYKSIEEELEKYISNIENDIKI